jgi:hypothetical protein
MEPNRLLAIAVATGRIGVVFFVGERLMDWRISNRAAKSRVAAAGHAQTLINELKPHVLVIERITDTSHKGGNTRSLIEAIARIGSHNELLDVAVARECCYANKYVEADALAERYPDIAAWKPKKRRFFDNEPRNTVLFEALALADIVLQRSDDSHLRDY